MSVSTDRTQGSSRRRTGWGSVRRATSLALWQAAPWVLVVLVVLVVLGGALAAWSTWSTVQRGATVIVQGDGGVAAGVSLFVGVATLFSWTRTVPTALPVLLAGGITRRAATGGLLAGALALAVVTTGMLAVVALAGAALQRALVTHAAALVVPSSGSDAYTSSLTIRYDAPEALFDPAETFPWFVLAALAGALVGAAWYRWRARGTLGTAVALLVAGVVYAAFVDAVVSITSSRVVDAVGGSSLVEVAPCLVLAAAVWLVLRRVPLRAPTR